MLSSLRASIWRQPFITKPPRPRAVQCPAEPPSHSPFERRQTTSLHAHRLWHEGRWSLPPGEGVCAPAVTKLHALVPQAQTASSRRIAAFPQLHTVQHNTTGRSERKVKIGTVQAVLQKGKVESQGGRGDGDEGAVWDEIKRGRGRECSSRVVFIKTHAKRLHGPGETSQGGLLHREVHARWASRGRPSGARQIRSDHVSTKQRAKGDHQCSEGAPGAFKNAVAAHNRPQAASAFSFAVGNMPHGVR